MESVAFVEVALEALGAELGGLVLARAKRHAGVEVQHEGLGTWTDAFGVEVRPLPRRHDPHPPSQAEGLPVGHEDGVPVLRPQVGPINGDVFGLGDEGAGARKASIHPGLKPWLPGEGRENGRTPREDHGASRH